MANSRWISRRTALQTGLAGVATALTLPGLPALAADVPDEMPVISKGDANYERIRRSMVWNQLKPDRYPDIIVQPRNVDEVIAAVKMAIDRDMKISVRGTGHHRGANYLRDGGMLLDISRIVDVKIDPDTMTATVTPGVRSGVLQRELDKIGLFFPTTHDPVVGLGGFLMGGGQGWCVNRYGFAPSSLIAIDVVTAKGELIHSSDEENPDYIWAARGAGPGMFGVVTKFYIKIYSKPQAVARSIYAYPPEIWPEVARWLMNVAPTMTRDCEVYYFGNYRISGPASGGVPQTVLSVTAMSDSDEEAVESLKLFETCPELPRADVHKFAVRQDMAELYRYYGAAMPGSFRFFIDNVITDAMADELVPLMAPSVANPPNDTAFAMMLPYHHAKPIENAALSVVAPWQTFFVGIAKTADDDQNVRQWVTTSAKRLDPVSRGFAMMEENMLSRPPKNILEPEKWEKYLRLKATYDPDDRFLGFLVGKA